MYLFLSLITTPIGAVADPSLVHDFLNTKRTLEYNLQVSREAQTNKIIEGSMPMGKSVIYPQKCSHQSLLGLDGKLKGRHPDAEAPAVERRRRWVNNHVGWEGDPVEGWPSSKYGQFIRRDATTKLQR